MKIASFDVGIRTFNFCIQEIVTCDQQFIIRKLKELKELVVILFDQLLNKFDKQILTKIYELQQHFYSYIKYIGKPKIEIKKWILTDLFPLSDDLNGLKCNFLKCKQNAKFYAKLRSTKLKNSTINDSPNIMSLCNKHHKCINDNKIIPDKDKNKLEYIKLKGIIDKYYCQSKPIKLRDINTISIIDIDIALINKIKEYPDLLDCDEVIIEKQPKFNSRVGRIESFLFHHFIDNGVLNENSNIKDVRVIHAKNKLTVPYDGPNISCEHLKGKYARTKYKGTKMVRYFLEQDHDYTNLKILDQNKSKQDDLCDNVLQCYYYIQNFKLK
jgi:hypothetical protein